MRILMWFTIGFALACGLSIYLGIGLWFCVITATCAFFLFAAKNKNATVVAILMLGITVGMLWSAAYDSIYLDQVRKYDGETVFTTATVCDYSYETDYGVAADAKTEIVGKTYKLRLYYPSKIEFKPGDVVEGDFRLRMTTKDSLQGETYHQGEGIFLLAYVSDKATVTPGNADHISYLGVNLRYNISQMIQKVFPEDTYAFATALLLGDSSDLDYETDTDFKVSGIRHIIAVSGLHVSVLMAVIYIFSGRRRYLSALIGLPVLLLFATMVGFTPSVVRACLMQSLVLLALIFNKEYDPPTALSFAALIMLCINPMTITSVSFQLSCGCVVGILLFYKRIYNYLTRLMKVQKGKSKKARFLRGISASISITISTTVATLPLSAVYFGAVSTVSVLTNLLTLWVVAFIFYGIGISCIAGFLFVPLAKWIAMAVSVPIRYVMLTAKLLADLPFAAVYTCSIYVVVWLFMCYALLAVFMLCKKKRPVLLAGSVCAGLVVAIVLSRATLADRNYQVTVFDVGQGMSVLVESDDRHYLIDCGGDSQRTASDTVLHQLLSRGITRLDGVIVTHYDKDHAGAVPLLLTGVRTDALYLPDIEDGSGIRKELENTHENIRFIKDISVLEFGSSKITLVSGDKDAGSDNERSLCILFQREKCDILITGDRTTAGEKYLMNSISLPKLELLVVGHHGSKTSTGFELLNTTRPKAAVISVGKDNYHGHPSKEVLQRLELFGCTVKRTDQDGTVIFRG